MFLWKWNTCWCLEVLKADTLFWNSDHNDLWRKTKSLNIEHCKRTLPTQINYCWKKNFIFGYLIHFWSGKGLPLFSSYIKWSAIGGRNWMKSLTWEVINNVGKGAETVFFHLFSTEETKVQWALLKIATSLLLSSSFISH